jgi:hypothetical protein
VAQAGRDMPQRSPRNRQSPSRLLRRLDEALGQLNPILVAVAMGLIVLDLTCLAAFLLPVSHLTACVATATPPGAGAAP